MKRVKGFVAVALSVMLTGIFCSCGSTGSSSRVAAGNEVTPSAPQNEVAPNQTTPSSTEEKKDSLEGLLNDLAGTVTDTVNSALGGGSSSEVDQSGWTTSQKNAYKSAVSYLKHSAFSHDGLISQLEYEQYSTEDATFAADNCGADWNEQALKSAQSYLKHSAFSHDGLIHQLEYEKFTTEQATYGADNCGADWNEQALKSAQSYLKHSSFSHGGLVDQLIYEGYTPEQAEYGVSQAGL